MMEIGSVASASAVKNQPAKSVESENTIEDTEKKRDTLKEDVVTLGNGGGNEPPVYLYNSNGGGNEPPK